jgi:hypothetical protein
VTVRERQFEIKTLRDKVDAIERLKGPPSASKSRAGVVLGSDDPKNAVVVRFYEDVSNVLVMNVRISRGPYFELEEEILTCVYSHADPNDGSKAKSRFSHCENALKSDDPFTA